MKMRPNTNSNTAARKKRGGARVLLVVLCAVQLATGTTAEDSTGILEPFEFDQTGDESAFFADIPSVYGASKYEQKVTEAPSAVSVITAEEIPGRGTVGYKLDNGLEFLVSGSYFQSEGKRRLFYDEFDDPSTNGGVAEDADGDKNYRDGGSPFLKATYQF